MMQLARSSLLVVLVLLAPAMAADIDDPWESDPKTTCSQTAWPLTGLGAIGLVVILVLRGAVISRNEISYRNPWWRLSWWMFGLSFLVGVVLVRSYCGPLFDYRVAGVQADMNDLRGSELGRDPYLPPAEFVAAALKAVGKRCDCIGLR